MSLKMFVLLQGSHEKRLSEVSEYPRPKMMKKTILQMPLDIHDEGLENSL
jgi:hypothetical protein